MDNRNRRAPVALAADAPVAHFVIDFCLAGTRLYQLVEDFLPTLFEVHAIELLRISQRVLHRRSFDVSVLYEFLLLGRVDNFAAQTSRQIRSHAHLAPGTAMIAPVP